MKKHSDNLKVHAGVLAVLGLNVHPDLPHTRDGFRELCRRAAALGERARAAAADMYWHNAAGEPKPLNYGQLSTPIFGGELHGAQALIAGILVWGDCLLTAGSTVAFREDGSAVFAGAEPVCVIPIEAKVMAYDTYNASSLDEISDDVLKELDVKLDKTKLAFAYSDTDQKTWAELEAENPDADSFVQGYEQVKYYSVYAPSLGQAPEGCRVLGAVFGAEPTDLGAELGCDTAYFEQVCEELYDEFLVEFVDRSQPFGYVAVETNGSQVLPPDDVPGFSIDEQSGVRQGDWYAAQFSGETRDAIRALSGGYDQALARLNALAA